MSAPVIVASGISKVYAIHRNRTHSVKERFLGLFSSRHRMQTEDFWALRDVSLSITAGEAVGLVGHNGSGKSTLLKLIAGIHRPTAGRLLVRRGMRISSMIELGVGFHAELTGRENVYLSASVHGLSREEVDGMFQSVAEYADIGAFLEEPIKNYSSGMVVRLAFAVAIHLESEVLLLDEIFAVGDADFQDKCKRTMQQRLADGKTLVFVSHSPEAIRTMCQRVCVLNHGQLVFDGEVDAGLEHYRSIGRG